MALLRQRNKVESMSMNVGLADPFVAYKIQDWYLKYRASGIVNISVLLVGFSSLWGFFCGGFWLFCGGFWSFLVCILWWFSTDLPGILSQKKIIYI
jgi:hypothetical protein